MPTWVAEFLRSEFKCQGVGNAKATGQLLPQTEPKDGFFFLFSRKKSEGSKELLALKALDMIY